MVGPCKNSTPKQIQVDHLSNKRINREQLSSLMQLWGIKQQKVTNFSFVYEISKHKNTQSFKLQNDTSWKSLQTLEETQST